MNKNIYIFTNFNNNNLFEQIFAPYKLIFNPIEKIKSRFLKNINNSIVILNSTNQIKDLDIKLITKNCLIITNNSKHQDILNKNIIFYKTPIPLYQFKNYVLKFISSNVINYEDISINDHTMLNIVLKKSCAITEVEKDILSYLVTSDNCSKTFIKKNILNINSNIETNSVENHFSRIRKKLEKIGSKLQIQSKIDQVSIYSV